MLSVCISTRALRGAVTFAPAAIRPTAAAAAAAAAAATTGAACPTALTAAATLRSYSALAAGASTPAMARLLARRTAALAAAAAAAVSLASLSTTAATASSGSAAVGVGADATTAAAAARPLHFVAADVNLGSPEKLQKGRQGEDALFVTKYAVGLADGVGGWAEVGIDAGEYSRALMGHAKNYALDAALDADLEAGVDIDPRAALGFAADNTRVQGSSTAVIATIGGSGKLRLINLGDSAAMVWRYERPLTLAPPMPLTPAEAAKLWSLQLRTKEQTFGFNAPIQIQYRSDGNDAYMADAYTFLPQVGDLLLLCSDGITDNLFDASVAEELGKVDWATVQAFVRTARSRADELGNADGGSASTLTALKVRNVASDPITDTELAQREKAARAVLQTLASALAVRSQTVGASRNIVTPFSISAPKSWRHTGGKLDDSAVVAAVIVPDYNPGA